MSLVPNLPRLVFTVTTGRSGTGWLARLLDCFPEVAVGHEPPPRMHKWMRRVLDDPHAGRCFWEEEKLPAIARCRQPVYVETSHLFAKGFFEPLIELGVVPDLILLRRDPRRVAASLYGLNTIPGRTELGRTYYLSPDDPVLLPLPGWEKLHDYQLCYWYCLETEHRRRVYGERARTLGARVVEVALEDLTTPTAVCALGRELELPAPGLIGRWRLHRLLRRPVNTKQRRKQRSLSAAEMAALEAELLERLGETPA